MGYNPKTIYWDFADFEKGGVATFSPNFGSNTLEREKVKSDSLVDLKLGRLGDFQTEFPNSSKDHTALMDPFSSKAGSSKRARTPSSGSHIVSCLVDGCEADLSKCRDYHRRHKVCEMHSKTSRVTIGGHEQRFCQQCSRFHSLGEFDEGKRSCRKRLEGHNRRRRKPQPEPLTVNPNLVPASQGGRFLAFGNQPEFPATSMVNCLWSAAVKSESNPAPYSSLVSSSYSNPHGGRHFPFLQVPESPLTGPSSAGPQKMFYNGINQVIDSDRALSLLSSSSAETSDVGLGRIIHPSPTSISQPNLSGLQIEGFAPYAGSHTQGFQGQHGDSELLPNMRSNNSVCQDGSSASGGYQTLSFSWE